MKTKTKSKKKLWNTVIEVPNSGKTDWYGGAYTFAFVYSNQGNFLVKGYRIEVQEYLKKRVNKGLKYFVNFNLLNSDKDGFGIRNDRSFWNHYHEDYTILEPEMNIQYTDGGFNPKYNGWSKWRFYRYKNKVGQSGTIKEFKRLPKKWLDLFDPDLIELNNSNK